jgi:nitrate reductase NapE component
MAIRVGTNTLNPTITVRQLNLFINMTITMFLFLSLSIYLTFKFIFWVIDKLGD